MANLKLIYQEICNNWENQEKVLIVKLNNFTTESQLQMVEFLAGNLEINFKAKTPR